MKTILALTDFSINAEYTAHYALGLAQQLQANLLVCNVYQQPQAEKASRVAADHIDDLRALVDALKASLDGPLQNQAFRPELTLYSSPGAVEDVVNELGKQHDILLAVVSAHSVYNFASYFKKDHTSAIIEKAGMPVLVIPYQVRFKAYRKIAFVSAANPPDIPVLRSLTRLAECSGAGLLIARVVTAAKKHPQQTPIPEEFAAQYHHLHLDYQTIDNGNIAGSLKNIAADRNVDVLALVHRRRGGLGQLFDRGITKALLKRPYKPLLIFPAGGEK